MKFQQPLQVTTQNPYPQLPPPVTSGGQVTFIDTSGEVWVAQPGINGGNWARARDVLLLRGYRNASGNNSGNGTFQAVWDAVSDDVYGMQTGGGFTCKVPGIYAIFGCITVTGGAAGNWLGVVVNQNGTNIGYMGVSAIGTAGLAIRNNFTEGMIRCATNDVITVWTQSNVVLPFATGPLNSWWCVKYIGTG